MKHLLLGVFIVVLIYAAGQLLDRRERRRASQIITRHGLRLGALLAVLFAVLALAYYLPSTNIL